jgi:hypothetical protein
MIPPAMLTLEHVSLVVSQASDFPTVYVRVDNGVKVALRNVVIVLTMKNVIY